MLHTERKTFHPVKYRNSISAIASNSELLKAIDSKFKTISYIPFNLFDIWTYIYVITVIKIYLKSFIKIV